MIDVTRERRLLQTFAALADTLVDDYDVVDLLQMLVDTCAELLDTTAAAILLADQFGDLDVVASTSEASRLVEVIQLGVEEGPCIESFRTGRVVEVPDIAASTEGWVRFKESALEQGFGAIFAVPSAAAGDDDRHPQPAPGRPGRARGGGPHRGAGVRGCRDDRHPARASLP